MHTLQQTLERLLNGHALSEAEAGRLLERLTAADLAPALAGAMRALARKPALPADLDAIDIVGTGGDFSGSLNLSTGAALLAASCGLPVVKHGNRSVTSKSGSADLIERLGFALPLDERRSAQLFASTGFTFLFAPYFHPAMKALAPVRAALGVRTVLNLLGPLTNPAAPRYRLIGAYDEPSARLIADALAGMPIERAWVVHGANGWDEATPVGAFVAFEVTPGAVSRRIVDPAEFGLRSCRSEDLKGGDAAANCAAMRAVFAGHDTGPHRDALVLQCGLALHIAGRSASVAAGIRAGGEALDSGRARDWLGRLEQFSAQGVGSVSATEIAPPATGAS